MMSCSRQPSGQHLNATFQRPPPGRPRFYLISRLSPLSALPPPPPPLRPPPRTSRHAPPAYARHRGFKCPVLFAISDNDRCISLRGYGWLEKVKANLPFHVYECDGNDLGAVFRATREAADKVRRSGKPAALVYSNLARRFGHAGTDRQSAYLTDAEIEEAAYSNPLEVSAVCRGVHCYAVQCALLIDPSTTMHPNTRRTRYSHYAGSHQPSRPSPTLTTHLTTPTLHLQGACAAAVAEGIVGYDELLFEFETIAAMTETAFEQVG